MARQRREAQEEIIPMLKTVEQMSKIGGIGANKLREVMDKGELEYIIQLCQVSPAMLDNLFQQLFEKGLSNSTVCYVQRVLSVSFEHARKYHYIESNPARDIITKFGKQRKTPDPYTIQSILTDGCTANTLSTTVRSSPRHSRRRPRGASASRTLPTRWTGPGRTFTAAPSTARAGLPLLL